MSSVAVARPNTAVGSAAHQSDSTSVVSTGWPSGEFYPLLSPFERRIDEPWSSSLREDALEYMMRVARVAPTRSTSHASLLDGLSNSEYAEILATPVSVARTHGNLYEIRRLTGLNWSRLAELLNVDRRTVHNWVKGGEVREANRHHVAETLMVLRFANRGSAELNAAALEEPSSSGITAFALIRAAQYDIARSILGHGATKSSAAKPKRGLASQTGEFQSMVMHEGADGTEANDPLPFEPMPKSRKRRLDRE